MKFLKNGNSYKKLMYPRAFVIYIERTGKRRNYHSEHTPLIYAHIMLMIKENLENSFIPLMCEMQARVSMGATT